MSYKRKIRKSRLLWGEGYEDKALFKHLQSNFQAANLHVHIGSGSGGSAKDVIDSAAREIGNFQKRLVVLDRDDKTENDIAKTIEYARKKKVDVHFVTPCLEAVILHVLNRSNKWKKKSSKMCKHEVESAHIARKKRTDQHSYAKLTKAKILSAAKNNDELKLLTEYISNELLE